MYVYTPRHNTVSKYKNAINVYTAHEMTADSGWNRTSSSPRALHQDAFQCQRATSTIDPPLGA